jgi:hypothetical protein
MYFIHSGLATLAAVAGLAVIVYALYGAATKRPHDKVMKNLAITYRSLMDLTAFMGVVTIMTGFGWYTDLGVHIVVMLLATAVAHVVPAVMRRRPQAERSFLPYAVATAISLALVAVGIVSLTGRAGA